MDFGILKKNAVTVEKIENKYILKSTHITFWNGIFTQRQFVPFYFEKSREENTFEKMYNAKPFSNSTHSFLSLKDTKKHKIDSYHLFAILY